MKRLGVIVASTRPNRIGRSIGDWFVGKVKLHGAFEPQIVDLKELNLPPMDEPNHPMRRQYQHEHTKVWSRTVSELDALVIITPEYNYGLAPALVNALDYLYVEWNYKPASFVSYGGVSGGTRAVQMTKPLLTSLKMMPIPEAVAIPFVGKLIGTNGEFQPGDTCDEPATKMLDELRRWTDALAVLRKPA